MRRRSQGRQPKRARGVEWIGGIFPLPHRITGEGEPYHPEVLLWLHSDGLILGSEIGRPGELLGRAGRSLRQITEAPLAGEPHLPERIRVASPALADAVRDALPATRVVCGPTPELREVVDELAESLEGEEFDDGPYLTDANAPDVCASFCRAAAALYRAAPWDVVDSDGDLLGVTIEALGVRGAVVLVIGQLGQNSGIVVFRSSSDFEQFLFASIRLQRGEDAPLPAHFSLNFDAADLVPPGLRREIEEHGWEVASEDAYPWLLPIDPETGGRPPTAEEVAFAEAVARALPSVLEDPDALHEAWDGGDPVSRHVAVRTAVGEVTVTVEVPAPDEDEDEDEYAPPRPADELLGRLHDLEQEDGLDPEARTPIQDALFDRFRDSPEARDVEDAGYCTLLMDLAADHLGCTIAGMRARDLEEVVFELIPRKVSVSASEARSIVETTRAFFAFLGRDAALPQAEECLRVLGPGAAERLEAELSDPRNFGMAKSFVMAGEEAGYDLSTQEGLDAWMEASNGRLPAVAPPGSAHAPSWAAGRQGAGAAKKKKAKRKQAKKARRTNAKKKRRK